VGLFVCVCVCLWVCYHDKSKLRASILTKLSLQGKVVTISSWLNFGRPAPPGRGSAAGRKFLAPPYYSQRAVFVSLSSFYPRDVVSVVWMLRQRGWLAGWVAGCLSVTRQYCIKTAKPIWKLFRLSDSPIILVFYDPCADTNGNPFSWGVKYTG